MIAVLLSAWLFAPTPSPTISPVPSAVEQWYALKGANVSGLDVALVRAVIDAESGGDPNAVSKAGAIGLMQLKDDAAADCGIDDPFKAETNVECGARLLADLVRRYGLPTAIAAYNFGPGNVAAAGGHFTKLPHETQVYVKDVLEEYDDLQHHPVVAASPTPSPNPADWPKAPAVSVPIEPTIDDVGPIDAVFAVQDDALPCTDPAGASLLAPFPPPAFGVTVFVNGAAV